MYRWPLELSLGAGRRWPQLPAGSSSSAAYRGANSALDGISARRCAPGGGMT